MNAAVVQDKVFQALADPSRRMLFSIFLGVALSISAMPVIAKTLHDLGLFKTDVGLLVMTAAAGTTPYDDATRDAPPAKDGSIRFLAVETTEFKVQESATLAQTFAGYGGQFNHHVYAAISRAVGVTG